MQQPLPNDGDLLGLRHSYSLTNLFICCAAGLWNSIIIEAVNIRGLEMRGTLSKMSKLAGGTALALALNACVVADYGNGPGYASPRPSSSYEPRRAPVFNDAYYTIDQADGFASAIGASPPDYSFRYGRNDAWMWNGVRGESLIMESGQRGDVQYYFQPRGSLPYLIRDEDDISYGFDRGYLVAVFGPNGTIIADGSKASDRDYAEQLLGRARELLFASQRRGWDSRSARSWSSSFGIDFILNSGWGGGWRGQPGWNPYSRYDDYYYYWRQEEWRRRHDHGDRYRDWYRRGGRNAPPVYAPPVYTETPHTRPVLGDRAGPIMDAGGRDGPREGLGGGIALPPALVPPVVVSPDAPNVPPYASPPQIAIDPRTIEDLRVSEEPLRRRPRPIPNEGVVERVRPQNEVISVDPQPDSAPTDMGRQQEFGRQREAARQRQVIEDQQLREEQSRVQAEMERSRQQGLEQAGRAEREQRQAEYEQSHAWEEQRRVEEGQRQQAERQRYEAPQVEQPRYQAPQQEQPRYEPPQQEQPRYQAPQQEQPRYEPPQQEQPRYQAPRVETPPPPPPPQVDTPPPPPPPQQRHQRPQRVDDGNERPD